MKQFIMILIVLALAGSGAYWLIANKPEIKKHSKKPKLPVVKVVRLQPQDYQITVHSSGTVEAATQTNLVAEVAGKITRIGNAFQEGSYVKKGELLLKIDDTDYRNNISISKAEIAQRELALKEQIAQSKLAQHDWDLFGEKKKKPGELALRKPHIASAKAALKAAKVKLEQAQIQLARTTITAPYAGRVISRKADVGQYVTPGTPLGTLFATDKIEVRLPLALANYELLGIPESYEGESQSTAETLPDVTFFTENATGNRHQWHGKLVRSSAVLDNKTRQIAVIARIDQPFSRNQDGSPPVKLGQFLQADITGKQLHNVVVIPEAALGNNNTVLLFEPAQGNTELGKVNIQPVHVLYHDADKVVIATDHLPWQDLLITTRLALATNGMMVKRYSDSKSGNKSSSTSPVERTHP